MPPVICHELADSGNGNELWAIGSEGAKGMPDILFKRAQNINAKFNN